VIKPTHRLEEEPSAVLGAHLDALFTTAQTARNADVMGAGPLVTKMREAIAVRVLDALDFTTLGVYLFAWDTLFEGTAFEFVTGHERHGGKPLVYTAVRRRDVRHVLGHARPALVTDLALSAWGLVIALGLGLGRRPTGAGVIA